MSARLRAAASGKSEFICTCTKHSFSKACQHPRQVCRSERGCSAEVKAPWLDVAEQLRGEHERPRVVVVLLAPWRARVRLVHVSGVECVGRNGIGLVKTVDGTEPGRAERDSRRPERYTH